MHIPIRNSIEIDQLAQHIAGRARDLGDDRTVLAGEGIQQAGLARVWGTDDGQNDTVAQQPALARFTQ